MRRVMLLWSVALGLASLPSTASDEVPAAVIERNEAAVVDQIRTFISAEAAYQGSNAGFYDVLPCLVEPSKCIPGYKRSDPTFLTPDQASLADRDGYRRKFHGGAKAAPQAGVSPSSLQACAYTAVPIEPGKTGRRGFCGDNSGLICETADGTEPPVENGICEPCTPLHRAGDAPPPPTVATHSVELNVPDQQRGLVKLALVSDGTALRLTATFNEDLASGRGATICPGAFYLDFDADNTAATGAVLVEGSDKWPGYEYRVVLFVCGADFDEGSGGTPRPKGAYAFFRTERYVAGVDSTEPIHDVRWKDPRTPVNGRTLEVSIPYAEMALKPGQVVRLRVVHMDVLLTLK